jgi:transposase
MKMTGKKPVYTDEFKFDAVRLVLDEGLTKAEVSRRLGINQNSLGKWVRAYKKHGENGFPGKGRQTPDQERIGQLEKENRELRMEREILKKATVFFARETK